MMFHTEDELLYHFMDGGCMVDTESGEVYISDVNADGDFFGIFVSQPVPENVRRDFDAAIDAAYYETMDEYAAPGYWFGLVFGSVMDEPERFLFGEEQA